MKKIKSRLSLFFLILFLPMVSFGAECTTFTDIDSSSYKSDILYASDKGWVSCKDTFNPLSNTTRREAIAMALLAGGHNPPDSTAQCFDDIVDETWARKYICYAKDKGIITANASFRPADDVSFQEASKMIIKSMNTNIYLADGEKYIDKMSPMYGFDDSASDTVNRDYFVHIIREIEKPRINFINPFPTNIIVGDIVDVSLQLTSPLLSGYSVMIEYLKSDGTMANEALNCSASSRSNKMVNPLFESTGIELSANDAVECSGKMSSYPIGYTNVKCSINDGSKEIDKATIGLDSKESDSPLPSTTYSWKISDADVEHEDNAIVKLDLSSPKTIDKKWNILWDGESDTVVNIVEYFENGCLLLDWMIDSRSFCDNGDLYSFIEEITLNKNTKSIKLPIDISKEGNLRKDFYFVDAKSKVDDTGNKIWSILKNTKSIDNFWIDINVVDTTPEPNSRISSYQVENSIYPNTNIPKGKPINVTLKGYHFSNNSIYINTDDNVNKVDDANDKYEPLTRGTEYKYSKEKFTEKDYSEVTVFLNTSIASGVWFIKVGKNGIPKRLIIEDETQSKHAISEEEFQQKYSNIYNTINKIPLEDCTSSVYTTKTGIDDASCEILNGIQDFWINLPEESLDIIWESYQKEKDINDLITYQLLYISANKFSKNKEFIEELKQLNDEEINQIKNNINTTIGNIEKQIDYIKDFLIDINYYLDLDKEIKRIQEKYSLIDMLSPTIQDKIKAEIMINISSSINSKLEFLDLPSNEKEYFIAYISTHLAYEILQLANPFKKLAWIKRVKELEVSKKIKLKVSEWRKYTKALRNLENSCKLENPFVTLKLKENKGGNQAKECNTDLSLSIKTLKGIVSAPNYLKVLNARGINSIDAILFAQYSGRGLYKENIIYNIEKVGKTIKKTLKEKSFSYHHVIPYTGKTEKYYMINQNIATIIKEYFDMSDVKTDVIFKDLKKNDKNQMRENEQNFLNKEWNLIPQAHHIGPHNFKKDTVKAPYYSCIAVETCLMIKDSLESKTEEEKTKTFKAKFNSLKRRLAMFPIGTISSIRTFIKSDPEIASYNKEIELLLDKPKVKTPKLNTEICEISTQSQIFSFSVDSRACYPRVFTNIWGGK